MALLKTLSFIAVDWINIRFVVQYSDTAIFHSDILRILP